MSILVASYDDQTLAFRVASKFNRSSRVSNILMFATEFESPEALKNYLHDHPGADKSKHHVKKPDAGKPKAVPGEGHEDKEHGAEEHHEEPKKSWKDKLKGLSDKAQSFFKEAPKAVKKFCTDDNYRRKAMQDASASLEKMPEKAVKNLVKTVKDEIHEFKEAGAGIKAVLKGGKMTPHQKKAFKTVATHIALTVAATALTSTGGPLAAAGLFGKSMVKHVAMKAVSNSLGHLHILQELGHIGHGIHHVLDKLAAKEPDADTAMTQYVMALVTKELQKVDHESMAKVLEDSSSGEADKEASVKLASYFRAVQVTNQFLKV